MTCPVCKEKEPCECSWSMSRIYVSLIDRLLIASRKNGCEAEAVYLFGESRAEGQSVMDSIASAAYEQGVEGEIFDGS